MRRRLARLFRRLLPPATGGVARGVYVPDPTGLGGYMAGPADDGVTLPPFAQVRVAVDPGGRDAAAVAFAAERVAAELTLELAARTGRRDLRVVWEASPLPPAPDPPVEAQ